MRILVLADNDNFKWTGPNEVVDLVVSCGDVYDSLIVTAAQCCSAQHVLAVKGNHDSAGPFPPPITDVHLHVVGLPNGFRVGGFNGCCRYKPRGHFLYDQDEASRLLQELGPVDILLAHNSPRGVHEIDDDVHQGFVGLCDYIRTHSPRLLVHGHQHVNRETMLDGTRVLGVYGHAFIET